MGRAGVAALGFALRQDGLGLFPMFAVKESPRKRFCVEAIDSTKVHDPDSGCDSGMGERIDAAVSAEVVLGGLRSELVEIKVRFAREDLQRRIGPYACHGKDIEGL